MHTIDRTDGAYENETRGVLQWGRKGEIYKTTEAEDSRFERTK